MPRFYNERLYAYRTERFRRGHRQVIRRFWNRKVLMEDGEEIPHRKTPELRKFLMP